MLEVAVGVVLRDLVLYEYEEVVACLGLIDASLEVRLIDELAVSTLGDGAIVLIFKWRERESQLDHIICIVPCTHPQSTLSSTLSLSPRLHTPQQQEQRG